MQQPGQGDMRARNPVIFCNFSNALDDPFVRLGRGVIFALRNGISF